MSLDQRARAEQWRRQQDEASLQVGAIIAAIFMTPAYFVCRALYLISTAPGKDLNRDGAFSISDVFAGFMWAFFEPAIFVLTQVPLKFWEFFEVGIFQLPQLLYWAVAIVTWLAIAVCVGIAAMMVGRVFGYLGKGASVGIGRVQMRLPQLMATDIVIIAVVIVVVGGFALGTLFD